MKFSLQDGTVFETHIDHIGRKMHNTRDYYERALLDEIGKHVRGGTFVDIGANIGNHSVFFARYLADSVIAFEPNPANFALLEKNTGCFNVLPIPYACAEIGGTCNVSDVPENMGMCEIMPGNSVLVVRADEMVTVPVSLIKIDAEKSTESALRGCEGLIKQNWPVIVLEGRSEWLESLGYRSVWSGCATKTDIYVCDIPKCDV